MDAAGSVALTDEQQEFYAGRFGERYTVIAENPVRPSRKLRRAAKFGQGRQRISPVEVKVFDRQQEALRALEKLRVRPEL